MDEKGEDNIIVYVLFSNCYRDLSLISVPREDDLREDFPIYMGLFQ